MKRNHWLPAVAVAAAILISVPAGAVVVQPSDMQGWTYASQQGSSSSAPVAGFANGPAAPPAGTGSFQLRTGYSDADPLSKVYLGTNNHSGVALSRITSFKYYTYLSNRDYDAGQPPMIELLTDSGASAQQRRFWYLPSQSGTVVLNTWQEWDLMATTARWELMNTGSTNYFGNWEWLRKRYDATGESMKIRTPYVGDYRDPMNASLQIANQTGTGLSFKIGSGQVTDQRYGAWWRKQSGVHAYVDKLIVGIDGVDYEFDFEFGTLPTVIINNKAASDPIMAQAKNSFNFSVFGRVDFTDFTSDTLTLDDGSGNPILVKAMNHGVNPFEYVKATGRLTPNTTPPTLDSQAEKIEKIEGF